MKKITATCLAAVLFAHFALAQFPTLTKKEQLEGWTLLFDGRTSNGWKSYRPGRPFPEKGWGIENGVLTIDPAGKGGDIITTEEFSDFELSLEFRTTKGANSGIKYFILPGTNLGCEFQILDDAHHPDAKQGKDGNRLQGALYDLIPPKGKKDKPVGKWNHARIISKGNHVEHWLNGKKIVEYERNSDAFKTLIADSKFRTNRGFSTPVRAPILLQDHGDPVSFRNIKIRRLTAPAALYSSPEQPQPRRFPPLFVNINCSEAQETQEWAENAAVVAKEQYPFLIAKLDQEGYKPADTITIIIKPMEGVAHAAGRNIVISAEWIKRRPDDIGMVVHELIHILQAYRHRVPGWVTEGIADYLRFFYYERNGETTCRVNPDRAKYTDSYRITAAFFDWIVRTKDAGFIKRMNAACRDGRYSADLFGEYTGMTIDELWDAFIRSLKEKTG